MRFHQTLDPNQWLHLCVQAVTHELKLAIRGNETDCSVILKPRQSHALVELDVFHLDSLASCSAARGLEHGFVVQTQPQLGHTAQITLHLNSTQNLGPEHVSVRRHQQVERFDHVQENLVFAVADALASPGDGIGDSNGWPSLHFELV